MRNLFLSTLLLFATTVTSVAQTPSAKPAPYTGTVNISVTGTYLRPAIFYKSNSTAKLPLVIFLHGTGQAGNTNGSDVTKMYGDGLPKVLKDGFKPPFDMVMVAPQHNSYSLNPSELEGVIADMSKRFSIDPNRIYLTGLSAGGFGCFGSQTNVSAAFAKKIAAIGILYGATQDVNRNNISWYSTPTWAIVGNSDVSYRDQNIDMVNRINAVKPELARISIRPNIGHAGAVEVYNGTWKDANGQTIWDWFQKQSLGAITPPVEPPVVVLPPATGCVTKAYCDSLVKLKDSAIAEGLRRINNINAALSAANKTVAQQDSTLKIAVLMYSGCNNLLNNEKQKNQELQQKLDALDADKRTIVEQLTQFLDRLNAK